MDEILDRIHQAADERHRLYRLAGRQHLNEEQLRRLNYLSDQLPILWDRHRRELAARITPRREARPATEPRAA
jgi:hypothetical protein